jgi:hypothetical protein
MPGETTEIHEGDLMLAEAAKLDLVLARHVHAKALATDDTDELCKLVHGYTRATRSMRQNLGMLTKQKADRAKAEREARTDPGLLRLARQERIAAENQRFDDLSDAAARMAEAASGGDRARYTGYIHRLDRELEDWYEEPDFLDYDLDTVVRHTARVLGLSQHLADRWQHLPEPTMFADPAEADDEVDDEPQSRPLNWPPGRLADDADHQAVPDVPVQDSA